jgi:hypothetical protein
MANSKKKRMKPQELAKHIAAVFGMIADTDLRPARDAMACAIDVLRRQHGTSLDLNNPDEGIPFALDVARSDASEVSKSAAQLLRVCLHAIEDGVITPNAKRWIPLLLTDLGGYVADSNARAARHKRPNRSQHDALDEGLDRAVRERPEGTWKEHAQWLEGDGVITEWDDKFVTFTDGQTEITITRKTFQTRRTEATRRGRDRLSRVAG